MTEIKHTGVRDVRGADLRRYFIMAGKKRRRKRSPIPIILLLAVAVLIAYAVVKVYPSLSESAADADLQSYFGISDGEAAIVVNDEIIDAKGILQDDTIYLDYDTVREYLNDRFLWDESSGQMLLTLPSGTESWKDGDGTLLVKDGTPYISASCVKENSDIDMDIFSDPDRVVARTKWDNIPTEVLTEDSDVRLTDGKKGEILTHVKKGDTVVLTQNADNWCCVATNDGFIGYVKKDVLKSGDELTHTSDPRFSFEKISVDGPICMGWQYTEQDSGLSAFGDLTNNTGVNIISPTWFTVNDNKGTVSSLAAKDYVDQAHNSGIMVWGCFQDVYDNDGISAASYLQTESVRQHIIDQLIQAASDTGMDGINLDIETITEEATPYYLQFIRELCEAAHKKNLVISVDNYTSTYTQYLNRKEQAETADYLVIMGYDEHTTSSGKAGSVASISFVEQGITDLLNEGVDASRVINGIPFYSRGWTQNAGEDSPTCEVLAMGDQKAWADSHGITVSWDANLCQNTGKATVNDTTYSIWEEDAQSIESKMQLVEKYQLAGVAAWRLGLETADVWNVINQYLKN